MKTLFHAVLLGVSLLLSSATQSSSDITRSALPSQSNLQHCGSARLKVLFWEVYQSHLFTPANTCTEKARPLYLEIEYLRDIKGSALVEQTGKEWRAQALDSTEHAQWLQQLNALWPDVGPGDRIGLLLDSAGEAHFYFNNQPLGHIVNPAFGRDFVGIWLAENTTRPALRRQLLGLP